MSWTIKVVRAELRVEYIEAHTEASARKIRKKILKTPNDIIAAIVGPTFQIRKLP